MSVLNNDMSLTRDILYNFRKFSSSSILNYSRFCSKIFHSGVIGLQTWYPKTICFKSDILKCLMKYEYI